MDLLFFIMDHLPLIQRLVDKDIEISLLQGTILYVYIRSNLECLSWATKWIWRKLLNSDNLHFSRWNTLSTCWLLKRNHNWKLSILGNKTRKYNFTRRVTWNYVYSPFNTFTRCVFLELCYCSDKEIESLPKTLIFATQNRRPWIIHTMNSFTSNFLSWNRKSFTIRLQRYFIIHIAYFMVSYYFPVRNPSFYAIVI